MNMRSPVNLEGLENFKTRKAAIDGSPSIFSDIFKEDINIAIWQRELAPGIVNSVDRLLELNQQYQISLVTDPDNVFNGLMESESELIHAQALCRDISQLVEKFCALLNLEQVKLQLSVLDYAMCPRFHVDRIPCRLICTYSGVASEWLPHDVIDRSKLGDRNNGLSDDVSGLYQSKQDIKRLMTGDVAILKGELWERNENAGLVHRSPQVPLGDKRLLLALDFDKFYRFGGRSQSLI